MSDSHDNGAGVETVETRLLNSTNSTNSTPVPSYERAVYPVGGLIAAYMTFARSLCESADVFLLGSILAVTAGLIARRCYFPFGSQKVYPNIFAMICGHPGDRKSSAIQLAHGLIARPLLEPNRFLPETVSGEALFDEYDEVSGGSPDKLLMCDDANALLATWRYTGYGDIVGKRFLSLYDNGGLRESFRRNRDRSENSGSQRYIPETSTSVLLGATLNIAQFQGQEETRTGLQRRFIYYLAQRHGRFIPLPKPIEEKEVTPILDSFRKLLELQGTFTFSSEAKDLWHSYQKTNRTESAKICQDLSQSARIARLNSEPIHVLKVAMLFQACELLDSRNQLEIQEDILTGAIEHVKICGMAASQLDQLGDRARITTDADWLYAKVFEDFQNQRERSDNTRFSPKGSITLSRTQLTSKVCHHSGRRGALTPDVLYGQLIPNLVERDLAEVVDNAPRTRKPCIIFLPKVNAPPPKGIYSRKMIASEVPGSAP